MIWLGLITGIGIGCAAVALLLVHASKDLTEDDFDIKIK